MTKKEIGMRKLMKYVEEMQKEGINICRPQFQQYYLVEMMLVSKYYGLIKWLVENDKIDLGEKLFNLTKNDSRKSTICDLDNNDFSWEDTFLMLLSISDTPIEDLISYLK